MRQELPVLIMVYPIANRTFLPLIRFFIKKTVGLENIPMKGPYIFACKHMGPLDGIFIGAVIINKVKQKIYFVSRIAKWGWFWEKIIAEHWVGCIPYYRENPRICLEIALEYLKKGKIVGIFPEGIMEEYDPQKSRAKTGTARLAIWAKVPILPVGFVHDISVKNEALRLHRRQVIKNILLNPHSLEIHIGRPFELKEYYNREMTKELLNEATDKIMNRIDAITKINII